MIPGATVVLISEARGTRSAPAITNATGDFVFPNVTVDTYTIEVTMPSFSTLRRTGVPVSAGSRVTVGDPHDRRRRRDRDRDGQGRSAGDSGGERRAVVHHSHRVGPEPAAREPRLHVAGAAWRPASPAPTRSARRPNMSTNITMDGISTLDTGSNTVMLNMNMESIAEVKVLVSGYQAEYGRSSGLQIMAVTKSGTNRFRGSVYDVERNSDWNANSKDEHPQRRSRRPSRSRRTGATRSAVRSGSRAATTSSSSSTRSSSGRAPAGTISPGLPRPDRAGARPATSRRPPTTTAIRIPISGIRC